MSAAVTYCRTALLHMGATMLKSQNKLPISVYNRLRVLNISRVPPTRRGSKGNRRNLNHIPVCINRPSSTTFTLSGPGSIRSNLINVTLDKLLDVKKNCPTLLSFLNARSACNKTATINDCIVSNDLDLLAITETWMNGTTQKRVSAA